MWIVDNNVKQRLIAKDKPELAVCVKEARSAASTSRKVTRMHSDASTGTHVHGDDENVMRTVATFAS